jgi:hypothetical protein
MRAFDGDVRKLASVIIGNILGLAVILLFDDRPRTWRWIVSLVIAFAFINIGNWAFARNKTEKK